MGLQQGYRLGGKLYCNLHLQQALPRCHNCGKSIAEDYNAIGVEAHPVCRHCSETYPSCYLCASPADPKTGGERLADSRYICGVDRKTAVFSQEVAHRLFQQASSDVQSALGTAFSLKVPVKEVKLVDITGLMEVSGGQYPKRDLLDGRVLGLTTLTLKSKGSRRWTEPAVVHLLSGIPSDRLLTVCAHEYAHVWHAENHPNYSVTNSKMREGFAEWVAYKVSQHRQRERQMAVLTYPSQGVYYEGLQKFLEIEKRSGVSGVLKVALSKETTTDP